MAKSPKDPKDAKGAQDERPPRLPIGGGGFSQQLLIWFLIIVVGVLFGMGPVLALLRAPQPGDVLAVSQVEIRRFSEAEQRLARLGLVGRAPADPTIQAYRLRMAGFADNEGLMPKGETLDSVVGSWLDQEVAEGRTRRSVLAEYGGAQGVPPRELEHYVQVTAAISNLTNRYILAPAVPLTAADGLAGLVNDRVEIAEVELSPEPLMAAEREAVAGNEDLIQERYKELREDHFRVPPRRLVAVVAADPRRIAEHVRLDDAEVERFYEEHKEERLEWRLPEEEDAADDAATDDQAAQAEEADQGPRYQPLAEVADEIRQELREEHARALAAKLDRLFDRAFKEALSELALPYHEVPFAKVAEVASNVALRAEDEERLTADVGLVVVESVEVSAPEGGDVLELPGFGTIRNDPLLFDPATEPGAFFETAAVEVEGLQLLLRLRQKIPASFRELDEVRDAVIDYIAARRAYDRLFEMATTIASRAEEAGEDGLRSHFAAEEVSGFWGASVATRRVRVLTEFEPPPPTLDGIPGDSVLAIELARPARPVVLASAAPPDPESAASLAELAPRVRLIQAVAYHRGERPQGARRAGWVVAPDVPAMYRGFMGYPPVAYREMIESFLGRLFEERFRSTLREG